MRAFCLIFNFCFQKMCFSSNQNINKPRFSDICAVHRKRPVAWYGLIIEFHMIQRLLQIRGRGDQKMEHLIIFYREEIFWEFFLRHLLAPFFMIITCSSNFKPILRFASELLWRFLRCVYYWFFWHWQNLSTTIKSKMCIMNNLLFTSNLVFHSDPNLLRINWIFRSQGFSELLWTLKGVKVFKNEPSKICWRQPLKNLKRYGLFRQKAAFHKFYLVHSWVLWPKSSSNHKSWGTDYQLLSISSNLMQFFFLKKSKKCVFFWLHVFPKMRVFVVYGSHL